jgi:hypothetical protein
MLGSMPIFLAGPAERACPVLYLAKQTLVQRYGEVVGQRVSPVPREPAQAGLNVRLLQFVELFAGRDVRLRRALSARRCARPPRSDGLTNRCLRKPSRATITARSPAPSIA